MNQRFSLNIRQVGEAFGWPRGGAIGPKHPFASGFQSGPFWHRLTSRFLYDPQRAKASRIVSPGFRYAHRIISSTIFARGQSVGVVSTRELYFLWHMAEGDERLCPAMWLMDHFEDVATSKGEISIGGMITILALYHNLNIEGLETAPGETLIDIRSMKAMHWIMEERGVQGYIWLVSLRKYAYLPDPERTVIYQPENWLFYPDFEWEANDRDEADEEEDGGDGQGGDDAGPSGQGVPVPPGGYEQQLAALQGEIQDLRVDFGSMRSEVTSIRQSVDLQTANYDHMRASMDHMTSEFQGLRNDLRSWARFQGWNPPE